MIVAMTSELEGVLNPAFSPRGLAIYGASDRPGAMGGLLVSRILSRGFAGDFVLVSARQQKVSGHQTVTSARGAGVVDHALIVVPAAAVPEALVDAAAAGARVATVFSSGFSEVGGEGVALEEAVRRTLRETGLRMIGPNCLGFINFRDNIAGSTLNLPLVQPGPVSIIGQSGSVSARLASGVWSTGTGLDLMVTIGNSLDLGPAAMVEYLTGRASTKVILLYLESLGDPEAIRAAIRRARAAGKEVVVLKSGRTEAGARTAASHTGATASKDVFVDLLLRDAGAVRAHSVREACDVSSLLARVGRLRGRALVVAPSGGDCTLAADRCSELDIPLAVIRDETQAAMKEMIPICASANPVDPTTTGMREGMFAPFMDLPSSEPDVDYLIFMTSTTLTRPEAYQNTLAGLYLVQGKGLPIVVGAPVSPESREALAKANIALVEDSERVFEIVRAVLDTTGEAERPRPEEPAEPAPPPILMGELEALDALRDAGLPMIRTLVVEDDVALRVGAADLGYPLVLKGVLPGTGHKSGLGLVKLDLHDWPALLASFEDVSEKVAGTPGARIVLQPAVRGALAELIVGVVSDPVFGKHVTLGMGGVFTDFLKERAWAKAPVDHARAAQMLDELAIGPGLKGARKGVYGCAEGVIDAVVRLSEWAVANDATVGDVEINPLMVRRDDVVGVDALVSLKSSPQASPATAEKEAVLP